MPLDRCATQTTATNNPTYLVNNRRRVLGRTSVDARCCCAPSEWTAGCFPPNPCMKLLILIMTPRRSASFNHLVGAAQPSRRHGQAQRVGGFEIDYKLEL